MLLYLEKKHKISKVIEFINRKKVISFMEKSNKPADATDAAAKMTDERLISDFGAEPLDEEILEKWRRVTGKEPHPFMKRGLYFCHRGLNQILDAKQNGKQIYLYTGRGPSSDALHLGHLTSFIINKYIQEALDCWFIIQVTDDEKFMRDVDLSWETIQRYTEANIRDIIAQGYDPEKTFIMRESKWYNINQNFLASVSKTMSLHVIQSIFGFTEEHNVGYVVFPARQIAPAFAEYFPGVFDKPKDTLCLIPCGREQDPYFRFAREIANKLKCRKVSTLYGRFIPALQGESKMTASSTSSAIYLTDTPQQIKDKIYNHAYTCVEDDGADLTKDVVFQYLAAFDPDDDFIDEARRRYGKGELKPGETRMTADELKERLTNVITDIVVTHQKKKAEITPELVEKFEKIKKAPPPSK